MSNNLEAIQELAHNWANEVESRRSDYVTPHGDRIMVLDYGIDPIERQAHDILKEYERQVQVAPDDAEAKVSLCLHLWRMGEMYFNAVSPNLLIFTIDELTDMDVSDEEFKLLARLHRQMPNHAQRACSYLYGSMNVMPFYAAVYSMAEIFRIASFYATALYWYDLAVPICMQMGKTETAELAKKTQMRLRASGDTNDPPLSSVVEERRGSAFPNKDTPGLRLEFQK